MKVTTANSSIRRQASLNEHGRPLRPRTHFAHIFINEVRLRQLAEGSEITESRALREKEYDTLCRAVENEKFHTHPFGIPGLDMATGGGTKMSDFAKPVMRVVDCSYSFSQLPHPHWCCAARLKLIRFAGMSLQEAEAEAAKSEARAEDNNRRYGASRLMRNTGATASGAAQ